MTPIDDRDRRLLEAVDHIGPASAHVLAFHPIERRFDTYDELGDRLEALVDDGYLTCRTVVDVLGDPITAYDTVEGWAERLETVE